MEQKGSRRENWIDAAKGIAILIVVLNHSGLVITGVNFWGGMFYVPAFFLLAGYTYEPKEESYKSFVKRKAKRLLVPYFVTNIVLALFFLVKDLLLGGFRMTGKAGVSFLGILYGRNQLLKAGNAFGAFETPGFVVNFMPNLNAPTWFLPALFLVLICADGLFRLMKRNKKRVYLFTAVLAFLMLSYYYLVPFMLPWCLDILPYLSGFFLIGYELKDGCLFGKLDEAAPPVKYGAIAGILTVTVISGLYNGSSNLSLSYFGKTVAVSMISAVSSSCVFLLILRWIDKKVPQFIKLAGRLSKYTLTILCWHYFVMQMFYAFAAVIIPGIGTGKGQSLIQLAGIVLSVTACVILHYIYERIRKSRKHGKNGNDNNDRRKDAWNS